MHVVGCQIGLVTRPRFACNLTPTVVCVSSKVLHLTCIHCVDVGTTASVIRLVQFLMQVCSRNDMALNNNAGASSNSHWADSVCNDLCAASLPEKAATTLALVGY